MTIVTLSFATSVVWLVVEAKSYSDLFAMCFFTHSYSRESSIERGSYSMAYYIAGHESERHLLIEDNCMEDVLISGVSRSCESRTCEKT